MRIVLDLLACQGSSTNRGIGRYSLALAQAMLRQGGGHEFRIVLNNHFPDSVAKLRLTFADALPQSQISVFDLPAPIFEHDRNNSWRLRAAEQLREHYLASLRPDMVHLSSLFEGLGENACGSVLHNSGQYDNAVTLYDLIPLIRKETYLTDPHVASWYYRKLQSLKNAELLLAISGHSRQEAMTALQLPGERVVNISSAVDTIFVPRTLAPPAAEALRARYGLTRPYIMYTGGIDYRKNIEGLIEAYAQLPGALRQQYQLAVVCSIPDGDRVRLNALAARFGLAPADLVLTGFVSDDDLVSLYNLTSLFVFPSLQEGFGLPALEAMSCGVPVIGSNNSSIPEVIGRGDALFDPNSVADISAKMHHALTDADFSASLAAHGLVQAKLFSWDASARKAIDAFEARHAQRQHVARSTVSVPDQLDGRRPRLAFVSPLPPERSGIADTGAELLPELARYYDIDLVLDQPVMTDTWATANFPQRSVAWFDANAHRFDRILYHFGNSSFHHHMFPLLARHPGVVELHDFFLSGAVNYIDAAKLQPNFYCQSLYASHGYPALAHEQEHGRAASYYQYPNNKAVLDQATGVIIHSAHSAALAERWYGPGRADAWRSIPLLRLLQGDLDRAGARRELGFGERDFVVCSFGLLAITKCNDRILEAWLASALAEDRDCHLVFVGENNIEKFGQDLAKRMSGHKRIKITGFATPALYRSYLMAADAAVQLRTLSRGETSGTILDCLAFGLPTIINSHGSGAEVSADVTIKLPDQFTIDELSAALVRLRAEPDLARRLSQRGADYMLRQHHPARIGEQYRDAIEHFAAHSPGARYADLMRRLAALDTAAAPSDEDWLQTAACIASNQAGTMGRQLLVDITALAAEAGPERTLLRELVLAQPAGYRIEPVLRVDGGYRYARRATLELIGRPQLVLDDALAEIKPGDMLLHWGGGAADAALANRGVIQAAMRFDGAASGGEEPAAVAQAVITPAAHGAHGAAAVVPAAAHTGKLPAAAMPVRRALEALGGTWDSCLPLAGTPAGPARAAARTALELAPDDVLVCALGWPDAARQAALQAAWQASPLAAGGRYRLLFADAGAAGSALAGADLALHLAPLDAADLQACLAHGVPSLLRREQQHG
ncbi:glycosyltransferase [Rugamonas sp.]|uniref:glycosyltransferase n=1 Tax=Rugamonas sp. TaxID=1926287 RepID=UPI0025EB0C77|nr:glycosyltransferase [Rugamonas sp.]